MHEYRPCADDIGRVRNSPQCILEKRLAKARTVFSLVDRQAGQQNQRNGMVCQSFGNSGRRLFLPRTSCRNGIEADHPPATVHDIGAGCLVTLIRPGKVLQPLIQRGLGTAIERGDSMLPG